MPGRTRKDAEGEFLGQVTTTGTKRSYPKSSSVCDTEGLSLLDMLDPAMRLSDGLTWSFGSRLCMEKTTAGV